MKRFKGIITLCLVASIVVVFTGCTQLDNKQAPVATSEEKHKPQQIDIPRGLKCYYMLIDGEQREESPSLTLFSDGTFGFSYDTLNSYYAVGNYEVKEDKLIASTEDGKYHYTFKKDGDNQYVFIADESSDVALINKKMGVPIEDGVTFKLDGEMMHAVVKEINGSKMMVSSREDNCPGAFDVSVPTGIDLSNIQGGDEVLITWDGTILETDPAQIKASYVEIIHE